MQVPGGTAAAAAAYFTLARVSAPPGPSRKLATLAEDELELSERDLWEEDAEPDAVLASTSAPALGLDTSSESEQDPEPPSPDIKAFHGESQPHQDPEPDSPPTDDDVPLQDNYGASASARRSIDSRLSTDSASAMPIVGSVARHRSRRPPLRANSTFASRTGMQRQASVKMGSSAPINIPIMSRLPSLRDDEAEDAKKPFVPPHLVDESRNNESLQQHFSIMTGVSPGASVKREKLQQRNAILRRTGFIEGPACLGGVREVMDPIKESHLEKEGLHSNPSALTAALGSSPAIGSTS
ncbi:TPA: hypothetical protein ACH3X1_014507 [Trebouxia sp. C0004]